jgi:hypothetical protein
MFAAFRRNGDTPKPPAATPEMNGKTWAFHGRERWLKMSGMSARANERVDAFDDLLGAQPAFGAKAANKAAMWRSKTGKTGKRAEETKTDGFDDILTDIQKLFQHGGEVQRIDLPGESQVVSGIFQYGVKIIYSMMVPASNKLAIHCECEAKVKMAIAPTPNPTIPDEHTNEVSIVMEGARKLFVLVDGQPGMQSGEPAGLSLAVRLGHSLITILQK